MILHMQEWSWWELKKLSSEKLLQTFLWGPHSRLRLLSSMITGMARHLPSKSGEAFSWSAMDMKETMVGNLRSQCTFSSTYNGFLSNEKESIKFIFFMPFCSKIWAHLYLWYAITKTIAKLKMAELLIQDVQNFELFTG